MSGKCLLIALTLSLSLGAQGAPTIQSQIQAGSSNNSLSFIAIGDWGYAAPDDMRGQVRVSKAMQALALRQGSPEVTLIFHAALIVLLDLMHFIHDNQFILSVGDNFYYGGDYNYEGVISPLDDKWGSLWSSMYDGPLATVPWLSVLGNHDWYASPDSQISYSKENPRWGLENYFWTRSFVLPSPSKSVRNTTVDIIFIDTNLLVNGYDGDRRAMKENFKRLGWVKGSGVQEKQFKWIERKLQAVTQSDYVLVVGHHPLGTCPHQEIGLMPRLKTLLVQNRVSAYFFGHHHALQATQIQDTLFIQTGAGGRQAEEMCSNSVGWGRTKKGFGYVSGSVSDASLEIVFYTESNHDIARYEIGPRSSRSE